MVVAIKYVLNTHSISPSVAAVIVNDETDVGKFRSRHDSYVYDFFLNSISRAYRNINLVPTDIRSRV